jgi:hypothetical protein
MLREWSQSTEKEYSGAVLRLQEQCCDAKNYLYETVKKVQVQKHQEGTTQVDDTLLI